MRRGPRPWAVILAVAVAACAGGEPTEPGGGDPPDGDPGGGPDGPLSVAFVGNSLTGTFDIPGLVQAMADSAGRELTHTSLIEPNSSLEDHWSRGTPQSLRDLGADVVVLQQGPSTLPENRDHLIHWAGEFATVIRDAGGTPALFMVWPSAERLEYLPDVWTSYRAAADAVGGLFIPAGQTWAEAWALDSNLALYGPDGFHANGTGALAAAQTIYAVLFDLPADSVPDLDGNVSVETQALLRTALSASLEKAGAASPDRP